MSAPVSAMRVIQLAAGEKVQIHLGRHERLFCEAGRLELRQVVTWVGTHPLESRRMLYTEQSCAPEDGGGWVSLAAGEEPVVLHVQTMPGALQRLVSSLRGYLKAWQDAHQGKRPSHA